MPEGLIELVFSCYYFFYSVLIFGFAALGKANPLNE